MTWLISGWIAARSSSVSSMNTRGIATAIRVSKRNVSTTPGGVWPSQLSGAIRYRPGFVPYIAPSRTNASVR